MKGYEKQRANSLKKYWPELTPEQILERYREHLAKQSHRCGICGDHESKVTRRLAVDHCHTTGKVRGLLCSSCNLGLGMFKDGENILRRARNYLKRHSHNQGELTCMRK